MHQRFLGFEERTHIVSLGFGFQTDVEHTLCPTFDRPSLTLAQIVDGAPIGKSDNLIQIHGKIVFTHGSHRSLALVERHPWKLGGISREVHVAVVVRLHIGDHRKVAGQ